MELECTFIAAVLLNGLPTSVQCGSIVDCDLIRFCGLTEYTCVIESPGAELKRKEMGIKAKEWLMMIRSGYRTEIIFCVGGIVNSRPVAVKLCGFPYISWPTSHSVLLLGQVTLFPAVKWLLVPNYNKNINTGKFTQRSTERTFSFRHPDKNSYPPDTVHQ